MIMELYKIDVLFQSGSRGDYQVAAQSMGAAQQVLLNEVIMIERIEAIRFIGEVLVDDREDL